VLPDGQVLFSRWDYTGTMHMYLRPLMVMNPDGTGQRAVYGSNSYWPNALYFARGIPGAGGKIIAIVAGYHGVPRMGELVLLDITKGWHEAAGVVQRIPGRGQRVQTTIRDKLVEHSWPKFLHPWPLSDKYFLVAAQLQAKAAWNIYLVDVFDNIVLVREEPGSDLFEPIPLKKAPKPPIIPDRTDYSRKDAVVYLHDVYAGPGLAGVPRGTIKRLRIAAYHYGYPGLAGPDKVGCGGPWEVMRIIGTVPVYEDGSACFRVPANIPLTFQALDAEGKAVQLMRSWYTAMPGEVAGCVGCHERPCDTPRVRRDIAATRPAVEIQPWHGPPRGFDFEREVQPVLDRYCVGCHRADGPVSPPPLELRAKRLVPGYQGRPFKPLEASRLHPDTRRFFPNRMARYTPAYEALLPFIRRVGIEDEVNLLVPGEYHADTSELIQMLKKGHYGVQLDAEAWDRLVTWIDLNAPCYGAWQEVCPVPDGAARRRWELAQQYGGPPEDFEAATPVAWQPVASPRPVWPPPESNAPAEAPQATGWPFDAAEARRRQTSRGEWEKTIALGDGFTLKLVRIPAGEFVMGDAAGEMDERPPRRVVIARDYWLSAHEITNAQFRRFDPGHDSGRFSKRYYRDDGPGLTLNDSEQPAVRVCWRQAIAFCRWLSAQTGLSFTLPTESQWEYACRAGSAAPLAYGDIDADFSSHANLADAALSRPPPPTGGLESNITTRYMPGIFEPVVRGGDVACDDRFNDGVVATAPVGRYQPNAWGLYDMHGNAAEWTRSVYRPTLAAVDDLTAADAETAPRVVRGGSFCDRPKRARAAFRLAFPPWQRVHNVGFRVMCEPPAS
jgi:formylglycine-generating enzyme required for sulfatase activity